MNQPFVSEECRALQGRRSMPRATLRHRRGRVALATCAMLLTLALTAWTPGASAPASPYLGPLTGDVPQQGLVPFVKAHPILRARKKVEVLVFETMWDMWSATDRWAIVKALDQFGSWSGLGQGATTVPSQPQTHQRVTGGTLVLYGPPVPTYDWSHARYRSRYATIVHYALQTRPSTPLRRLPPRLERLLIRYSHLPEPVMDAGAQSAWPAIAVGGYAMHGGLTGPFSGVYAVSGPGVANGGREPANDTFAGLQAEIRTDGQQSGTSGQITDFNASVNVMIALICHADGRRPAKACRRPAIRMLLKRIR